MNRRIDPLISASRGTLVGDLLWLGAIGFIIAIITGMIGCAGRCTVLVQTRYH